MYGYIRKKGRVIPLQFLMYEQLSKEFADRRQKELQTMPNMHKVTVPLMYGQVRIEIEITSEDDESLTLPEIKGHIDWLISEGLQPATFGQNRVDNIGKKGTVASVKPIEGTKMYEVIGKVDDDTEFKWREFNATTFRKGDRFVIIKNDRGFKAGELVLDDLEQQEFDI